jgi:hypothetical protein
MLLSRYRYQNQVLLKPISNETQIQHFLKVLMHVQSSLLILKKAADIFNNIFGWTTLLNIFTVSIRTLTVLDILIKNERPFQLYSDIRSLLNTGGPDITCQKNSGSLEGHNKSKKTLFVRSKIMRIN